MSTFNHDKPFQTKCGWPARKLSVLDRRAFPLVVAVRNPAYDAEELHTYWLDGTHSACLDRPYQVSEQHPLCLVNTDEKDMV